MSKLVIQEYRFAFLYKTTPIRKGTWGIYQLKIRERENLTQTASVFNDRKSNWGGIGLDVLLNVLCERRNGMAESRDSGGLVSILLSLPVYVRTL